MGPPVQFAQTHPLPLIHPASFSGLAPLVFRWEMSFSQYRAELERRCLDAWDSGSRVVTVVVTTNEYRTWCAVNGVDEEGPKGLEAFAQARVRAGLGIPTSGDLETVIHVFDEWQKVPGLASALAPAMGVTDAAVVAWASDLANHAAASLIHDLPANGRIRVVRGQHGDEVFDLDSDADAAEFLDEEIAQLQIALLLGLLAGGWALAECADPSNGLDWAYSLWQLGPGGFSPLSCEEAMTIVTGTPALQLEGLDPDSGVDAFGI